MPLEDYIGTFIVCALAILICVGLAYGLVSLFELKGFE